MGERGPEGPPNPNAENSNTLDNLDSADFLRSNAAAGGDLAGTYPNPTVGPDKIAGAEVFPNSLSGSDIDESTLGQVPAAANATTAANAAALGGHAASAFLRGKALRCISDISEHGGPQCGTILNEPGALRISVVCDHDSSGSQGYRVWVRFATNTNNAWIRAYGVDDADFDAAEQPIQLQGTDDWHTFVYRSAAGVTISGAVASWESSSSPHCELHGFAVIG